MKGNFHDQFLEGWVGAIPPGYSAMRHNWCMAEIMWHRRETRRQTENTNVMPGALEGLILLDKNSCGFTFVVFEESPKPFTTPNWACTCCILADRRKEQHIALAMMIPFVMEMLHVLCQCMAE